MVKPNKLDIDYVSSVAGNQVTDDDASSFLQGLAAFNEPAKHYVDYDILKRGYIVSKTLQFDSFEAAMRMVRKLNQIALTRPIVYQKKD
jgi:hypothetical protein